MKYVFFIVEIYIFRNITKNIIKNDNCINIAGQYHNSGLVKSVNTRSLSVKLPFESSFSLEEEVID